jgi:drug/metabolite transporter (DMT)-like permease
LFCFEAYARLSAQEAQSLNYSWGIVLGIFSVLFLKEKFRLINFIALLISFFGVVLISTKGNISSLEFTDNLGVVLALGSSLIWASYWLLNIKDKRDDIHKLFWNFFFGTAYILILLLLKGFEQYSFEAIISSAYVGIFEMGVTFLFWITALRYTEDTSKVSNVIFLSPFLSLFIISIVLKETIYFSTIGGLFLIISGIIIQNIRNRKS